MEDHLGLYSCSLIKTLNNPSGRNPHFSIEYIGAKEKVNDTFTRLSNDLFAKLEISTLNKFTMQLSEDWMLQSDLGFFLKGFVRFEIIVLPKMFQTESSRFTFTVLQRNMFICMFKFRFLIYTMLMCLALGL